MLSFLNDKANDNRVNNQNNAKETVQFPMPPSSMHEELEMEIYAKFMTYMRNVANNKLEIKILSSIQYVADLLDYSDGHISKILVDLGLRAPRMAFPSEFLDFCDKSLLRKSWDIGAPTESLKCLREHWGRSGDDKFAAFNREFDILDEGVFV